MARLWACERPGDAASVFAPGGAKPATAGPDDDADGDRDDDDVDSLDVPGFEGSTAAAGAGAACCSSAGVMGGAQGGPGPGPGTDDVVPGFGGGGGKLVMRLLDSEGEGLCLALGVVRMAHQCYRLWMARVHVAGSRVMIGLICGVGEMVEVGGARVVVDMMAMGGSRENWWWAWLEVEWTRRTS